MTRGKSGHRSEIYPVLIKIFPPDRFTMAAYCQACGHSADLPDWCNAISTDQPRRRLRCRRCRAKKATAQVRYSEAGAFRYEPH